MTDFLSQIEHRITTIINTHGVWQVNEASKEQFVRRNKLGILAVLRDLKKNSTLVMVSHGRGQFISKILDVLPDTNQLLFDLGSGDYDNQLATRGCQGGVYLR